MGTPIVCLLYQIRINPHVHTHRYNEVCTKVYLWKIPLEFREAFTPDAFASLNSWALRSGGVSAQAVVSGSLSCWALEMSHSEGDVLQPWWSQRVSLRATLCRVERWLTLVISKFPLWPQSRPVFTGTFLEKFNNNIIPLRLLIGQK